MNKFNIGDRVAFYQNGFRGTATIHEDCGFGQLTIISEGNDRKILIHIKQCRKLKKKKEPRRVWVTESALSKLDNLGYQWADAVISKNKIEDCNVEFVEVARKARRLPNESEETK